MWNPFKREKLNPAQEDIHFDQGQVVASNTPILTIQTAYKEVEVVNRGVNLIVDSRRRSVQFWITVNGFRKSWEIIPIIRVFCLFAFINSRLTIIRVN